MEDPTSFFQFIYSIIISYKFYVPVITICVTILLIKGSKRLVSKLVNKNSKTIEVKRKNTIVVLVENILKYLFIIIAILVILGVWGVDVSALITSLGILGVVGGLAIQDALKDIIMGCNIIMDNFFVVGDIVEYNGFTGEVIEFGLKNTKIQKADGTVFVISNRNISEIKNLSQKSASLLISIPTAYEEQDKKVMKVLDSICEEINTWKMSKDKAIILGIDSLSSSSVDYMIKCSCSSVDRWDYKRMILGLIKQEFDKNKIKIPYQQVEVHNGKDI